MPVFGLPYFWAISHDKDLTFTPKIYAKENVLLLNEYRQAYKNSFLTLDTSYTQGYKDTNSTKTDGSRNHIFGELSIDFGKNKTFDSSLSFKMQKHPMIRILECMMSILHWLIPKIQI